MKVKSIRGTDCKSAPAGGKLTIFMEYHGQGDLIPINIPLELLMRFLIGLIIGWVFVNKNNLINLNSTYK